jgi:hypothetical protein
MMLALALYPRWIRCMTIAGYPWIEYCPPLTRYWHFGAGWDGLRGDDNRVRRFGKELR